MIEKVEKSGWRLKTHWRVPWQLRSITQISSVGNSAIVCVLMKDSIVMWDVETQTYISKFSFKGKKNRVSVSVNDCSFTASCCDGQNITLFSNSPCLSTKFVGQPFHGLRILSSCCDKKSLLVTGSCDRDIRLWHVDENGFQFLDCVYGSTDGTHSLCFGKCGSKSVVFSGGAKRSLISWELFDNKLFLLKEFQLDQFGIETKVNFTVNCCALVNVNNQSFLYLGCSDGF